MRRFLLIAITMLSIQASAQINMTVQLPPTGVMQKAQLWNLLLVSASSSSIWVHVELRITDAQTNQPVLTGSSRNFYIARGAKQLQVADLAPITYEYLSPSADRNANGLLMAGSYMACYSVIQVSGDASSLAAEDCLPFAVEPVSPPLLNNPADQSVVEGNLPQFAWLPPAPLSIFSDLNYDFTMVELRKGQSAAEAMQSNIPVYHTTHLKDQFLNYPVSAIALDTAKNYAWTVTARNNNQFAAQTDIWTFKVKGVAPEKIAVNSSAYVQLKKELDASAVTCSETLQFGYSNDAGDASVIYELIRLDAGHSIVKSAALSLEPGMNNVKINLKKLDLKTGQSYLFRLKNGRREYWQIKFIYQ
ncbi:hypothetical protein [Chitinophaga sancti]|uniref:Uncharacterized protein n=1 Tax=Chitinophaga sancti TaxID=1004 RepID=A0A1K1RQ11_9BACT|nr:hypothetical protein [Chitinophaga sancti]WQD62526.1 hypothetical protein U0033_32040 [Chitinophaga sancti]WQG91905.1 hypothetical protein SR876_10345 [Chitinophaga sancti]SFW74134.1 hypothetical protein SAMN05661012_04106 [Chitinophaga sancti]